MAFSNAATVVVQPTVLANPTLFGTYNAANSCNQVGLSVTYTSGTTNYSTYVAQSPVQNTNGAILNTFVFTADGNPTGNWDFDLGATYSVKHFLFWNTQSDLTTYVKTFEILVANNSSFTGATSAGTFTATPTSVEYPTPLETFNLTATNGRYVRFKVNSVNGGIRMLFGEVAFAGDAVVANVAPVFTASGPFSIAEMSANGTAVGTVAATHGGDGPSAATFSITAGNTDGDRDGNLPFAINSSTGAITVNDAGDLDFETTTTYTLTVQANDSGSSNNTTNATVTINVTDVGTGTTQRFEGVANNATSFSSSGQTFTLTGNLVAVIGTNLGSNNTTATGNSSGYLDSGFGVARTGSIGGIKAPAGYAFRAHLVDVWPSNDQGNNVLAPPRTVTVIGKLGGTTVVSATAFTSFSYGQVPPTGGSWHRIDLSATAFRNTDIDTLEFSLGAGINYFAIDNLVYDSFAVSDSTAPTVTSIVRQTPSGQAITAGSSTATFRVTFSEAVNTPATSNFAVVAVNSSSIAGSVASVTPVSTSIYDVAVTVSSGTGEFRLKVVD